jgi:cytochrome c-type biogenesis protein CcmH
MVIWFVLLGIAITAIALMVIPLWRRRDAVQPRAAFDAQIYRDQLNELELDAERARITPDQAASARTEIARRLLASAPDEGADGQPGGRLTADGAKAVSRAARRGISVFVALSVPIAAFGVYMIIGSPHLPGRPAAEMRAELSASKDGPQDSMQATGAALVAQLGEKLKDRPNDLRGWTLYAESLTRIGRFDDAVAAYGRVTTLAPRDAELMSRKAEAQIFAAKGSVTPAARKSLQATLALDASEPRARYYLGLAESQAGKVDAALSIWIALEADSAPNAPWRAILAERIAKLAARGSITAEQLATRRKTAAAKAKSAAAATGRTTEPSRGPDAEDVRAAQSMSPEDRKKMIRGMVAGLAERLKNEPDNIQDWRQLARSYTVLGEAEKARDAYGHLAKLQPDNVTALADYAGAIARTMAKDAAITPEIMALGDRILALDPNHTGALWFTGMARAEAGDANGARERWMHLLTRLDPNSPQYADVKKSIEALDKSRR